MRGMVFLDRLGVEWRPDETYQDSAPYAPGWLALRSDQGEVRGYSDVIMERGIEGRNGHLYLQSRLEVKLQAAAPIS